jgi:hypothetical protein
MSSYREDAETRKVVLWKVGGTPKAHLFSTLPKGDKSGKTIWVPRSLITHCSQDGVPPGVDEWPRCIVEVEEWFLNKNDL